MRKSRLFAGLLLGFFTSIAVYAAPPLDLIKPNIAGLPLPVSGLYAQDFKILASGDILDSKGLLRGGALAEVQPLTKAYQQVGKAISKLFGGQKIHCVEAEDLTPQAYLIGKPPNTLPSRQPLTNAAYGGQFYTLEREYGIHCPARVFLLNE